MEIFELRYFFEVAKYENIHRASEKLYVSPGSLSKAISRIEAELNVSLFIRDGRNIKLTDQGLLLKIRAGQIIQLEESVRMEISGHKGQIQMVLAGPEVLLSKMGLKVTTELLKQYPSATFEFHAFNEERALAEVASGEAHLAFVTGDVPQELTSKVIAESKFVTVVGAGHPLHSSARLKKPVQVDDLLEYPFVSPKRPILGKVGVKQSLDGWRDDEFTRRVGFFTSSLKLLESMVTTGMAVAYIPDYLASQLKVEVLDVKGCPYTCVQKIKMVARRPKDISWMKKLF